MVDLAVSALWSGGFTGISDSVIIEVRLVFVVDERAVIQCANSKVLLIEVLIYIFSWNE